MQLFRRNRRRQRSHLLAEGRVSHAVIVYEGKVSITLLTSTDHYHLDMLPEEGRALAARLVAVIEEDDRKYQEAVGWNERALP